MKKTLKLIIIGFCIGMVYFTLEGFWRIPRGGFANIVMLPVGGLCGLLIGLINELTQTSHFSIRTQALLGVAATTLIEFIAGFLVNIVFKLNIWDYADLPFNLMGQVCLPFAFLWYFIMPLAIWLDDFLRWKFWNEEKPNTLISHYLELIK